MNSNECLCFNCLFRSRTALLALFFPPSNHSDTLLNICHFYKIKSQGLLPSTRSHGSPSASWLPRGTPLVKLLPLTSENRSNLPRLQCSHRPDAKSHVCACIDKHICMWVQLHLLPRKPTQRKALSCQMLTVRGTWNIFHYRRHFWPSVSPLATMPWGTWFVANLNMEPFWPQLAKPIAFCSIIQ